MLNEMNLPLYFWVDAIYTELYIINRCQIASVHLKTLEEAWSGRKPNLSHLKIFGCVCYVHVPDEVRTKLDLKSEECIFIGYAIEQKGYICNNPNTKDLKVSRDVVLDELIPWYGKSKYVQEEVEQEDKIQVKKEHSESKTPISSSKKEVIPWLGRLRDKTSQDEKTIKTNGKEKIEDEKQLWIEEPTQNEFEEIQTPGVRQSSRVK